MGEDGVAEICCILSIGKGEWDERRCGVNFNRQKGAVMVGTTVELNSTVDGIQGMIGSMMGDDD